MVQEIARLAQKTVWIVSISSSFSTMRAEVSPAPAIMVRNCTTVSPTATTPNSSGESNRARMGTVTNLSPNVPVFDKTLQPTFVVMVFTFGAGGIQASCFWRPAGGSRLGVADTIGAAFRIGPDTS
ncbi:hypothetical protein D3C78_1059950 [compost metagenome]